MAKDVVYIDSDDDITSVINSIESCSGKIVAVVPPKHASVLSSIVNIKLLKKSADSYKKSIVLITTEPNTVALAGAAKVHVARTLKSKPYMPTDPTLDVRESTATSDDLEVAPGEIPELHQPAATHKDDVIQLDNTTKAASTKKSNSKVVKKFKVPNFYSFRLKVFAGGALLVAAIVGAYIALVVLPKATVTLTTEVSTIDSLLTLTATTGVKDFDEKNPILPASMAESKKTDSEKVPATGKKDVGTKATGNVRMYNCNKDDKLSDTIRTVPAGSTVTDANGNAFVTQEDVDVEPSKFSGDTCSSDKASASVSVVASSAGGQFNLSPRTYNVGGFSTIKAVDTNGMGGGTSKVVTVVSNEDIESAKAKVAGKSKAAALTELKTQLEAGGSFALEETVTESAPVFTQNAAVDAEQADVTVTAVTTYTMLGIVNADIQKLVEKSITEKITDTRQKILDNGISKRKLQLLEKKSPSEQKFSIAIVATVGPDIDTKGIASELAGKTRSEIQALLKDRAGIKDITVKYDPFWVVSTPSKAAKIIVNVEQVNAQ